MNRLRMLFRRASIERNSFLFCDSRLGKVQHSRRHDSYVASGAHFQSHRASQDALMLVCGAACQVEPMRNEISRGSHRNGVPGSLVSMRAKSRCLGFSTTFRSWGTTAEGTSSTA